MLEKTKTSLLKGLYMNSLALRPSTEAGVYKVLGPHKKMIPGLTVGKVPKVKDLLELSPGTEALEGAIFQIPPLPS